MSDVYLDGASVNNQMVASGWAAYDSSDSLDVEAMRGSGENARKIKSEFGAKNALRLFLPIINARLKQILMTLPASNCIIRRIAESDTIKLRLICSVGINGFAPKKKPK